MTSGRWLIYTVETTPAGGRGPFGPITADDQVAAEAKATSMLSGLGLTVASVVLAPPADADPADADPAGADPAGD